MQHTLKDTAKNLESILVKLMNNFQLRYHPLFETFRSDILLLDAETRVIPDINNPNGLLMFSKLNENSHQDFTIPSATQKIIPTDRLFLFGFDPNPTEEPKEIYLPGIDQLPALIENQLKKILNRENVANPIQSQSELHHHGLKFTPTEKR